MKFWRISAKTVLASIPYCVASPVVAFIPAVACVPAVVSGHDIAVILNIACCWRYCFCLCHCYCLHPHSGRHSSCCWGPVSSWWFPVAVLSAIADVPGEANGVVGIPAVEHVVAGGPAVTSFPAVEGVLAVASVPVSDYGYRTVIFFCCRTIRISNIVLANSRNYRTIGYRIKASIYRTIGHWTQKKLSGAHLWRYQNEREHKLRWWYFLLYRSEANMFDSKKIILESKWTHSIERKSILKQNEHFR